MYIVCIVTIFYLNSTSSTLATFLYRALTLTDVEDSEHKAHTQNVHVRQDTFFPPIPLQDPHNMFL